MNDPSSELVLVFSTSGMKASTYIYHSLVKKAWHFLEGLGEVVIEFFFFFFD